MATGPALRRIVVGVDGSAHAAHGLEVAIRLARAARAEVVAVFALEPTVHLTHAGLYGKRGLLSGGELERRLAARARFLGQWTRPLADSGVEHRAVVEAGDPALVIAAVAERVDADLVVVGRRGRGTVSELLLGSVSTGLSHRCRRPLLLVSPVPVAAAAENLLEAAGAGSRPAA